MFEANWASPPRFARRPVEISNGNRYSITVQRASPNIGRGHAELSIYSRPDSFRELPETPECSFDPKRSVEAIAKDLLRKIVTEADDIALAYENRVASEAEKTAKHQALLKRLEMATGKPLTGQFSDTRNFKIGPVKMRVNNSGSFQTDGYSYLEEDEVMALLGFFRERRTMEKPVCNDCGSDQLTLDASVVWNHEKGDWDVTNVFDKDGHCDGCNDSDARWGYVEIEPQTA